ncbi:MAG TPA: hypothetical protein VGF42_05445 [Caulobacteraceae bacterium]
MPPEGLIVVERDAGPARTADRLVAAITSRGMSVMARVDHAAAAEKVGLKLAPTEALMFGIRWPGHP